MPVKPHPITRPVSVETHAEHEQHSAYRAGADGNGTAHPVDVPAQGAGVPRGRTADTSTSEHVVAFPDRVTRVCLTRHRLVW